MSLFRSTLDCLAAGFRPDLLGELKDNFLNNSMIVACLVPRRIYDEGGQCFVAHSATCFVKAKFHYARWFEAGRRRASNLSATSFEPASNQLA